ARDLVPGGFARVHRVRRQLALLVVRTGSRRLNDNGDRAIVSIGQPADLGRRSLDWLGRTGSGRQQPEGSGGREDQGSTQDPHHYFTANSLAAIASVVPRAGGDC